MSAPTSLETGRANVIASFNKWILDVVASLSPLSAPGGLTTGNIPFSVRFERAIETADLTSGPILCVTDQGLFAPARMDVNDRAVYASGEIRGSMQQTLIEFVIWGSQAIRPDEDYRIRAIRDVLLGAYRYAGRRNSSGQFIVDPIRIWKFGTSLDPTAVISTNNFVERDRGASWLTESQIEDPDHPEVRGWRGVLRVFWIEFFDAP